MPLARSTCSPRRYDLIPNLVKVAQRYPAHEAATLEAVTRARGAAVGAADAARVCPCQRRRHRCAGPG